MVTAAKGVGDQGRHRIRVFGYEELSRVETQILTNPSISSRANSKKETQKTCF